MPLLGILLGAEYGLPSISINPIFYLVRFQIPYILLYFTVCFPFLTFSFHFVTCIWPHSLLILTEHYRAYPRSCSYSNVLREKTSFWEAYNLLEETGHVHKDISNTKKKLSKLANEWYRPEVFTRSLETENSVGLRE